MKIFRTIIGIIFLLSGLLVIIERLYYHMFEIKSLYFVVPLIVFGFLLIYHRGNTDLFSKKKGIKIPLTIITLTIATYIHGYLEHAACHSKKCDTLVGYPFPMFIGTDTNTGLAGIAIFFLGLFLNIIFYYLLSALLVRAFSKKI